MGHFSLEKTVRGVPRKKLFEWFTDFSSEDVDIVKRRGAALLINRQAKKEGNNVHVENEVLSRGKNMKYSFDAELHPESFYYETRGGTPDMVEDKRRYTFEDSAGVGTKGRGDADYKLLRGGLRFLDAFGLVNGQMKGMEDRLMGAFLAEAEGTLKS
jgi:hypothetical protein